MADYDEFGQPLPPQEYDEYGNPLAQQFDDMGIQGPPPPPLPNEVLEYQGPTQGYMCALADNRYGIEFECFRVRDYGTNQVLFEIAKDPDQPKIDPATIPPELEDQVRCISYDFGADFLSIPTIGTELTFSIGPYELPEFRMIERHYFRNFLIKSFDFTFGFCIPNSTNTWEAIYDVPELPPELVEDMINNPFETESDSFYFVNDEMVMHNKAKYAYSVPDRRTVSTGRGP